MSPSDVRIERICVVGAGGREHALAATLARSAEVLVVPGSPGMRLARRTHSIEVADLDARGVDADLFVIGPEVPLVEGLADELRAQGKLVLGPGRDGARLEGSKAFMKELTEEAAIPTARYGAFVDVDNARAFIEGLGPLVVVKTDGLAAGKGVLVTATRDEAIADVEAKLAGRAFGDAGRRVIIEEGLVGVECSLLALCDGDDAYPLAIAQDYKRALDGDLGPNTGGMGAYAPVPFVDEALRDSLVDQTIRPMQKALSARGIDYRGVLYAGLMLTEDGPFVLEYNVRFGDPEAQVLLPLLGEDAASLLHACASGRLGEWVRRAPVAKSAQASLCVVLCATGYPTAPKKGAAISGLGDDGQLAEPIEGVVVYHAGTARAPDDGPFVVNGGRVLAVSATASSLDQARALAYEAVDRIEFDGMGYRTDIAKGFMEGVT